MSDCSDDVLYRRGEDNGSDTWDDTILIKAYDNAVSAMKAKFLGQQTESTMNQRETNRKKKSRQRSKGKKKKNPKVHDWNIGDMCKAAYTEDGELYAAQILSIDEDNSTCTVQYIEYGNEEEQPLDNLLPPSSEANSTDIKTDTASEAEFVKRKDKEKQHLKQKHSHADGPKPNMNPPRRQWNGFPSMGHPSSQYTFPSFVPPSNYQGHPGFGMPSVFPHIPPPPPLFNAHNCEDDNEALYTMLISWYMSGYHTGYYQGMKNSSKATSSASPFVHR